MTALELAESTYITLLRHPLDTWRIHNQIVLINLRDFISQETGMSLQETQEKYESIVCESYHDIGQSIYGFAD